MRFDYVIAGGGLQAGLLVLALRQFQPAARVAVVERGGQLGGNHTWSFHAADVPPGAWPVVEPLVVASWPAYRVRFPGFARTLETAYHTATAERFDAVVRRAVGESGGEVRLGCEVESVEAGRVTLAGGEALAGRCVIDARGPRPGGGGCGWQTFLGLEVELTSPWPDALPTLMDATGPQAGGYRFVYVLPLTPTRVLVEETAFADTPALDTPVLRKRVEAYLSTVGVAGWRVVREESGALPMPWRGGRPHAGNPLAAGYAGGWFHPATGYSFPAALKLALAVAAVPPEQASEAAAGLARRLALRLRYARFLNYLLFRLVKPGQRWRLFRRLHRALPAARLGRFYALEFTAFDAFRLVAGVPPPIDVTRPFTRPRARPEEPPC